MMSRFLSALTFQIGLVIDPILSLSSSFRAKFVLLESRFTSERKKIMQVTYFIFDLFDAS